MLSHTSLQQRLKNLIVTGFAQKSFFSSFASNEFTSFEELIEGFVKESKTPGAVEAFKIRMARTVSDTVEIVRNKTIKERLELDGIDKQDDQLALAFQDLTRLLELQTMFYRAIAALAKSMLAPAKKKDNVVKRISDLLSTRRSELLLRVGKLFKRSRARGIAFEALAVVRDLTKKSQKFFVPTNVFIPDNLKSIKQLRLSENESGLSLELLKIETGKEISPLESFFF